MEVRDKLSSLATRVLAYMPVLTYPGKSAPVWWSTAKQAVFHYCLSLIFKPFETTNNDNWYLSFARSISLCKLIFNVLVF